VNVTEEDEEEIVESLLEFWVNNKKDDGEIDDLRNKAVSIVQEYRSMQKLMQLINTINPD